MSMHLLVLVSSQSLIGSKKGWSARDDDCHYSVAKIHPFWCVAITSKLTFVFVCFLILFQTQHLNSQIPSVGLNIASNKSYLKLIIHSLLPATRSYTIHRWTQPVRFSLEKNKNSDVSLKVSIVIPHGLGYDISRTKHTSRHQAVCQ